MNSAKVRAMKVYLIEEIIAQPEREASEIYLRELYATEENKAIFKQAIREIARENPYIEAVEKNNLYYNFTVKNIPPAIRTVMLGIYEKIKKNSRKHVPIRSLHGEDMYKMIRDLQVEVDEGEMLDKLITVMPYWYNVRLIRYANEACIMIDTKNSTNSLYVLKPLDKFKYFAKKNPNQTYLVDGKFYKLDEIDNMENKLTAEIDKLKEEYECKPKINIEEVHEEEWIIEEDDETLWSTEEEESETREIEETEAPKEETDMEMKPQENTAKSNLLNILKNWQKQVSFADVTPEVFEVFKKVKKLEDKIQQGKQGE